MANTLIGRLTPTNNMGGTLTNESRLTGQLGGVGATVTYASLPDKPSINNVELVGNKTTSELNINYNDLKNLPSIPDVGEIDEKLDDLEGNITTLQGETSALDTRLTTAEGNITSLDERITTNEGDISDLQGDTSALDTRLTTAEGNITSLGGRVTTAEGNITSLGGRVTTAEGNITSLGGRLTTAEGNITSLDGRVTTNEGGISDLQGEMAQAQSDISQLNSSLNTKIAVEHIDLGSQTIGAHGRGVYTKSIEKSGYTAMGIINIEMANNYFYLGSYIARGNNAQVVVHSANNTQTSQQIWIDVLYIKN